MRWIAILLLIPVSIHAQTLFVHRLNWSPVPDPISGYNVYRSLNGALWLRMAQTTNTTVNFTNSQPASYKYRVTAYSTFGESLPSNEVSVDMRGPSSPTNLTLQVIIPVTPTPPGQQNR